MQHTEEGIMEDYLTHVPTAVCTSSRAAGLASAFLISLFSLPCSSSRWVPFSQWTTWRRRCRAVDKGAGARMSWYVHSGQWRADVRTLVSLVRFLMEEPATQTMSAKGVCDKVTCSCLLLGFVQRHQGKRTASLSQVVLTLE